MQLEMWEIALLITVGVFSGYLNVMAGGGSLLTLPAMVLLGVPGPVANGTNRIGILAQSVTAVATFAKRGFSDWRLSATLSLSALPGVMLGAWYGAQLDGVWFNRILALVMLLVLIIMTVDRKKIASMSVEVSTQRKLWGHVLMVFLGLYGGFIQVGIGLLMMPVLHRVLGMDLVRVNAHKTVIVGVYTAVALAIYATQSDVLWLIGGVLAIGNMFGGWLGAHYSIAKGEKWIRVTLNGVILAMIVKLLFGF